MTTTNHCLVYWFYWWISEKDDINDISGGEFQCLCAAIYNQIDGTVDRKGVWIRSRNQMISNQNNSCLATHVPVTVRRLHDMNMDECPLRWMVWIVSMMTPTHQRSMILSVKERFEDRCGVEGTHVVEETGMVWRHESKVWLCHTQTVKTERRVLFFEWFEIVRMMTSTRQK